MYRDIHTKYFLVFLEDLDSKTSTSSLSPPSSKHPDQINVDDVFRDRRVISVSGGVSDPIMVKRTDGEKVKMKGPITSGEENADGTKIAGPVKTHRIVINLDDKNRFTDEVTV